MEKLSITKLIDFRGKSDKSKSTFVNNLKLDKKADSSGGDYWVSSLSTISNVFKTDNPDLLDGKIEILLDKIEIAKAKITKTMFQRNIDILLGFKDFDFESLKPIEELKFYKKLESISIIDINGLPIQARPHHVFSYSKNEHEEICAVCFVTKLDGYKYGELGMFADILFRYLNKHYSKEYVVNPFYCVAVDVSNGRLVRYTDIQKGDVPILIDETIDEIKNLL